MNWLNTLIMILHLFLAVGIIGLVLIQRGKGADAGAGFGSGASGTVFGARGSASFLSRTTGVFAGLFFITSLSLAYFSNHGSHVDSSVTDRDVTSVSASSSSVSAATAQASSSATSVEVPATVSTQTQQSTAASSSSAPAKK